MSKSLLKLNQEEEEDYKKDINKNLLFKIDLQRFDDIECFATTERSSPKFLNPKITLQNTLIDEFNLTHSIINEGKDT